MEIPTQNLIGQDYIAYSGHTFTTLNPKTNTPLPWSFQGATPQAVNAATTLAASAFEPFMALAPKERATFLKAIAQEIMCLEDVLIETYCLETGLPVGRAKGERSRTIGQLEGFAAAITKGQYLAPVIDHANPDRSPIPKVDLRKMQQPIGPIVVFGASNFPLAYSTAGGDTASALATGCPVIVKAHPMHAGTSALVASAILKAAKKTQMPHGVFSNLNSNTFEIGQQLVLDPKVKGVGFTGSITGGTALYQLAQSRPEPIPVFAEMGSVNPVVVLPEALLEKAADWAHAYAGSIALGAGQFCTNPGLIFCLESPHLKSFLNTLEIAFKNIAPSTMLHPNIYTAYNKGVLEIGKVSELLSQSKALETGLDTDHNLGTGHIYKVNAATFAAHPRLHREVFGPISLVVVCKNEGELHPLISNLEGQLTGTILGNEASLYTYEKTVTALQNRVGRLIFNGVPTGVEVCDAMQHGGPFPASTDARFTAVGADAMKRWTRPVSYQNWPNTQLPPALQEANPLGLIRRVNGVLTKD